MADEKAVQFDLDDATRFVLSDPRARRFLWWVLENCHLFQSSMTGNSFAFHLEGERNIGLKIIAQIDSVNPIAFPKLMLDMKADEEAKTAKDKQSHVSEAE